MLMSGSLTDVSSSHMANNLQHSILATKEKNIQNLDFVRGLVSRPAGFFQFTSPLLLEITWASLDHLIGLL